MAVRPGPRGLTSARSSAPECWRGRGLVQGGEARREGVASWAGLVRAGGAWGALGRSCGRSWHEGQQPSAAVSGAGEGSTRAGCQWAAVVPWFPRWGRERPSPQLAGLACLGFSPGASGQASGNPSPRSRPVRALMPPRGPAAGAVTHPFADEETEARTHTKPRSVGAQPRRATAPPRVAVRHQLPRRREEGRGCATWASFKRVLPRRRQDGGVGGCVENARAVPQAWRGQRGHPRSNLTPGLMPTHFNVSKIRPCLSTKDRPAFSWWVFSFSDVNSQFLAAGPWV